MHTMGEFSSHGFLQWISMKDPREYMDFLKSYLSYIFLKGKYIRQMERLHIRFTWAEVIVIVIVIVSYHIIVIVIVSYNYNNCVSYWIMIIQNVSFFLTIFIKEFWTGEFPRPILRPIFHRVDLILEFLVGHKSFCK